MNFYKTQNGSIVIKPVDVPCQGGHMELLKANTTDAATEKHVPVVAIDGNTVKVSVGSVAHPMLEEHFINFIALETNLGISVHNLKPGEAPETIFALADGETAIAAYEYCNLHGLWKADI